MKDIDFRAKAIALLSVMALVCSLLVGGSAWAASKKDKKVFTIDFRIEECTWANTGRNAYFSQISMTFCGSRMDRLSSISPF